jgi:hypothetical protein
MKRISFRGITATAFALLCLGVAAFPTVAVGFPYEFNPEASIRGACGLSAADPDEDPGCPKTPPEGPHPPKGRFAEPRSIAIDAYGNEYVASNAADSGNGRIDVFDDEGRFLTEILVPQGPKSIAVDSKGVLYALETAPSFKLDIARYTPSVYEPAAGKIEYGNPRAEIGETPGVLGGLAIDFSNDRLFVSNAGNSISEYSSAAAGNTLLNTITNPKLNWSNWIAVDSQQRRLFASFCKDSFFECGVLVMNADAPYAIVEELDGSNLPAEEFRSLKGWTSIAVNEETGHFFVEDLEQTKNVYEFDENFDYVDTTTYSGFQGGNALQIAVSNSKLNPTAQYRHFLYVPLPIATGYAFAFNPPGEVPPEILDSEATNISEQEAELRATVKSGGGEVDYRFEYVTQAEFEATEWANASTSGAGTISKGSLDKVVIATLDGLSPGTAYRFRIVVTNDVLEESDEEEGAFRTYADAPVGGICPNESFRVGFSASLPDCRAYELVTPADTNGRPPKGIGFVGDRFPTLQASPLGDAVSFVTEGGSLPGMEGTGGFNGDRYRAIRGSSGWSSVGTGPVGTETTNPDPGSTSPDQGFGFWDGKGEGSAVINGQTTRYVKYPDGRNELVGRGSIQDDPGAEGKLITEGGSHIIFQTGNVPVPAPKLEPNAPPTGTRAVYDRTADEVTHVVSLLPGDVPLAEKENGIYLDASADGTGIAFLVERTSTRSALYLRIDNEDTYEIGDLTGSETGENITFIEVSEDGDRIFYLRDGDLFATDVSSGAEEEIRFTDTGNATVVNVAPDGSRAYFVSISVIPGAEENPNGAIAQSGEQNLYLSEEGAIRFVGTVTTRDVEGEVVGTAGKFDGLGLWADYQAEQPGRDPSRVSTDGSVLLFQSQANLDGYDPGESAQIYRYDSVEDRLHCVSCIPTEASATGGASLQSFAATQDDRRPPFSGFGFVPNLRFDGQRAFFQSTEALVSSDTDGVQDVYEWEEQGVGSCTVPGGCVYLISSGHSERDDYLYGVSRSGNDAFITTEDVLVGGDDDTSSIYDARVGGGFPEETETACEGEGCRPSLTPAPNLTPPAKPAAGDDNVVPQKRKPRCPKGKRKVKRAGKVRCVKKGPKKTRAKAGARKGAAR